MTTTSSPPSAAALENAAAVGHFAGKLRFETDPSDVHAALAGAEPGFVVVDSRGDAAWAQGRIPGAVHLPTAQIADRAAELLDPRTPVVTYCWGPGCNGSTRAALALAQLGYQVQEMIGGFEYWAREGLPVLTDETVTSSAPDPLTSPVSVSTSRPPSTNPPSSCDC
jgi:rhodanese-related sulfurtransferase